MPSRSNAQRRKMAILYRQGKISRAQWEDFKRVVPASKKKKSRKSRKKGS